MTMQIPQEVLEDFKRYANNAKFANEKYQELKRHVGEYVAIADGKILGYSFSKDELFEKYGNTTGVFIDLITPENLVWIL